MKKRKYLFLGVILLIISIIYTIAVKNIDVSSIGPNNSSVGFSKINSTVHNKFDFNEKWYKITKYVGFIPFALVAFYGFTGLIQLIERKSLKKVDKKLIYLGIFYIIFVLIYFFFEKVIINYRPVLIDGELEASYPSSHTLMAVCLCGSSMIISKNFVKNELISKILNILTGIVMIIIEFGRILSGVHWITDIFGGIIIATCLLSFLNVALLSLEKEE